MQKQYLKVFYAVTLNSLYLVEIGQLDTNPKLTKIESKNPGRTAVPIGRVLSPASMIAVGRALVFFFPDGGNSSYQRELSEINLQYWKDKTSHIVGLFLDETLARLCFAETIVAPKDERWKKETIEVLRAIGVDHPKCSVQTKKNTYFYAEPLYPPKDWMD